ncbi:MAG: hypothetical protein WCI49_01345 [Ferruginibacter sp.]
MKIISLTIIGSIAVISSLAQKIIPKPFLYIIKENRLKQKLYPVLAPLRNAARETITSTPTVVAAATDHMPVLILSADASLYHMPVLKMLPNNSMPNGYPAIKQKP